MQPRCVHIDPNALKPAGIRKRTAALLLNMNFLMVPGGTSSTLAINTSADASLLLDAGHKYFNIVAITPDENKTATRPINISVNFLLVIVSVILSSMLSLQRGNVFILQQPFYIQ